PYTADQVTIENLLPPVPTLANNATSNTICAGESVAFTAGGGDVYEFFVNGVSKQAASALNTYTTSALLDGQVVTVRVTDANGCSAMSAGTTMIVNPRPVVSLLSSDADNTICAGSSVTFTATPSGAANYQFFVNSTSA